jgi:hypothetical protein
MSIIDRFIPFETVFNYLNATKRTVVSVGCGNGVYEKRLRNAGLDVILVDPKPESWVSYPVDENTYLKPDYSYVRDLVENMPEIVGNCTLFLCWPSPNGSTYDIEAVKLLNPLFVVTFYETIGGAGGEIFHSWLSTTGAPCEISPCGKFGETKKSLFFKEFHLYPKYNIPHKYICIKEYIVCKYSTRIKHAINTAHALILIQRCDISSLDTYDFSSLENKIITV